MSDIYPTPPAGRELLRVGLMYCDSMQACWVGRMIGGIRASGAAEVVCAIRYIDPQAASRRAVLDRRRLAWAFGFHRRMDRARVGAPAGFDARSAIDGLRTAGARLLHFRADATPAGLELSTPDVQEIRNQRLDVILVLGSARWTGGLLAAAWFGVWSHGVGRDSAEIDSVLFQAALARRSTIGVELRLLAEPPSRDFILCRSEIALDRRSLDLDRRRIHAVFASLACRLLRRLHRQGARALTEAAPYRPDEGTLPCRPGNPVANLDLLRLAAGTLLRRLHDRFRYRHGEWWFIALRRRPEAFLGDGDEGTSLRGFKPLPLPRGHFHADPFLLEQDGATHLFFEDLDKSQGKGIISHCRLAEDGTPSPPAPALIRPYHLSYPFLFRWRSALYMLPETAQNRTIELYRCQALPDQWSLERVLLSGRRATDATLHEDEAGRWWMFATIDEQESGVEELFLFHADTPLGPWRPHEQNPVQSDVRHNRPAGRLFRRQGRLVRPAQDGARHYGSGLWLMEVVTLTPERYAERPLLRLGPEWLPGNRCLHHIDACSGFEVIDGMRLTPRQDRGVADGSAAVAR